MADESIDIKIVPEIVAKAAPDAETIDTSKATASEADWQNTLERHTIAELKEEVEEKNS